MPKKKGRKKETLSDQLKQAISDSGLSQYAIAKGSGVSSIVLSRWLSPGSKKDIYLSTASQLADFFGLELQPSEAE
jgi:transcriptional regulator with XRE-family HTH domain